MSAEVLAGLAPMDVAGRIPALREALAAGPCDGLLVTSLTNVRYLTGFTGSAGMLWVDADRALVVTDGRYETQVVDQLAAAGVDAQVEITATGQAEVLAAASSGCATVGLEADHVSWSDLQRYETWFESATLEPVVGLVEELRAVKDEGEVARIAAAAGVADAALANVLDLLGQQPSEVEFGLALDTEMRRLGASAPSFETIVASGPNGARPHHRPGERTIVAGDLVVIDFGATVDGYRSDMTRTVAVGEPGEVERDMLAVVTASQAAGVRAVAAGVACAEVDRAARVVIEEAGWGEAFVHGTGHGVGLDIHEAPRVGSSSAATLAAGQVVTVEPGVYLPAHGGVRVEDTVVVTEAGCRTLTRTPKDIAVA